MIAETLDRRRTVRWGQRLEYITLVVASAEAIGALVTGVAACSVALLGFGFDSLIEVVSGAALLWRLHHDANLEHRERAERTTLRVVGSCFVLLAVYVVIESARTLFYQERPERSVIGIVVLILVHCDGGAIEGKASCSEATRKRRNACRRVPNGAVLLLIGHQSLWARS